MNLSEESKLEILKSLFSPKTTGPAQSSDTNGPYEVGLNYHVRTVTMAIAGTLKSVHDKELVFSAASWVADTGRFNEYLDNTGNVKENEPFKNDVIIGRGAVVDCTVINSQFTGVK